MFFDYKFALNENSFQNKNIQYHILAEKQMFKIHKMSKKGKPFSYIFKWYTFSYTLIIVIVAYLENWF